MKRFLTILLTTLALAGLLCVTASASSFDGAAEELAEIGMFRGTGSGFDLDKAPTRGQAAIMLVRLFGAEPEAQNTYRSGRITCPFTDVNETAAPYVAWLVDEGLANGTSETTFGAADPCTARAYTIFLLRALGYQDGEDFTTKSAQEFAAELGILDTSIFTGTFLRDDLAAMTYQALGTDLKDGSTYLLDSLLELGDIDKNAARPIVEKIENLRALGEASKDLSKAMAMDLDMDLSATVSGEGLLQQTEVSGKGGLRMIMNRTPQMSAEFQMTSGEDTEDVKMWMQGDWMYLQSGGTSTKMEVSGLTEALRDAMEESTEKNSSASVLPFLESVSAKTSGKDTVYTVDLNDALVDLVNSVMAASFKEAGLPDGSMGKLAIHGFTIRYTVTEGKLKGFFVDAALSMGVKVPDETGKQVEAAVGAALEMEAKVTASGDKVKIDFPDFSGFEEIIGGADGPTGIVVTPAA